jgi:hypothetical protein
LDNGLFQHDIYTIHYQFRDKGECGMDMLQKFTNELTEKDYGFIIDENGDLKAVLWPSGMEETPKNVIAICKAFGVSDPDNVKPQYLN